MFILACFVIITLLYIYYSIKKPFNYPPGPLFIPLVGNLPQIKELSKKCGGLHLAIEELCKQYNTNLLGLKLGPEYTVVVTSYEAVRKILSDENFDARPDNFFLRLRSSKKGITGTDGETWSTLRKFTVKHMKNLGFGGSTMDLYIKNEIEYLVPSMIKCEKQLSTFIAPYVLNILWKIVAGSELKNDQRVEKLLNLLNKRSKSFDMSGGILNIFPWLRYILPEYTGFNLIKKINRELHEMMFEVINIHYKNWTKGRDDDFIYSFITEAYANKNEFFTNDHLSMVCLDLFIGGSQTTSTTLEFALLTMVKVPEIQEKVHDILDRTFSNNTPITYADRYKVPYIEAVLMEVQRLNNVAPIIGPRRALKNATLDGYTIKKNTTILISIFSIFSRADYWNDPKSFRPERFLNDEGYALHSDLLIPFGLGRRRCPNEVLARSCIFIFFCEIMRKYKIIPNSKHIRPSDKFEPGITLSPGPYSIKFLPR